MKKKVLILFLILILPISCFAITISPSQIEAVNLFNNVEKAYELEIFNNFNLPISEVFVENLTLARVQTLPEPIQPNSSKKIYLLVKSLTTTDTTQVGKLSFVFLDSTVRQPQTKIINVRNNSYPSVQIRNGDSINFNNIDLVPRTISSNAFTEIILQPNGSATQSFPTVGNFSYYDRFSNSVNIITVVSNSLHERIIRSEDSQQLTIHVKSQEVGTALELTLYESNFSMNYWDVKTSAIKIKNVGNSSAQNIIISGKWLSFSKDKFTLNAGQEDTISFSISPKLNKTEETNSTYIITVSAMGDNSASTTNPNIYVTIPYAVMNISASDFSQSIQNVLQLLTWCSSHSEEPLCKQYNQTTTKESLWKVSQYNLSEGSLDELFRDVGKVQVDLSNLYSNSKTTNDDLTSKLNNMSISIEKMQYDVNEFQKSSDSRFTVELILGIAVILSLVGFIVFQYMQKNKMENSDTL